MVKKEIKMANQEFNNIDEFINRFTNKVNGELIFGLEFLYKNKYYRITRDPTGFESILREKFHKTQKAFITFFEIPKNIYPNASGSNIDLYIGIYENVNDLLDNGTIDNIPLRNILVSN